MTAPALAPAGWWWPYAACRGLDQDQFFPLSTPGTDVYARETAAAMEACGACPVRPECLDFAVATRQQGIWGGTCDAERRRILSPRRRGAA